MAFVRKSTNCPHIKWHVDKEYKKKIYTFWTFNSAKSEEEEEEEEEEEGSKETHRKHLKTVNLNKTNCKKSIHCVEQCMAHGKEIWKKKSIHFDWIV
jgi:hypothetical protein